MNNFCVYISAGHGGLDPETGEYHCIAGGKKFQHAGEEFHGNGWFYEGVWNRAMADLVIRKLEAHGFQIKRVYHPYYDIPLSDRVATVNWYHKNWKPGVLIDIHANASPLHNARGYEIYTSPGPTRADKFATLHFKQVEKLLGRKIKYRSDESDGDHDKEARLFMLTRTALPAILPEHLFFDEINDARLLMDPDIMNLFAEVHLRAVIEFYQANKHNYESLR